MLRLIVGVLGRRVGKRHLSTPPHVGIANTGAKRHNANPDPHGKNVKHSHDGLEFGADFCSM
eukprot:7808186-Pyramimonas_sp.AAC.1